MLSSRLALCCAVLVLPLPLAAQILPAPPVPTGNPLTPDKVLLGKALFWDEQLSSSRTVACGTCHVFSHGGTDPRTAASVHPGPDGLPGTADDIHGSPGVQRHNALLQWVRDTTFGLATQVTGRRAPSPINAAYSVELFWDGRASGQFRDPMSGAVVLPSGGALESQIAGPPVSDVEMSHIGRTWNDIALDLPSRTPLALADQLPAALQTFVQGHTYNTLFQQVYGSPGVTPTRIIFAIASYERTLISDQSPFDLSLVNQGQLSASEARGLVKFRGLCAACHTDVDPSVLTTGPVLHAFRNVGVRPASEDRGRANVTNNAADAAHFKVPGLRNVALRAPFFHNGSRPTLSSVVDFYAMGGQFTFDPLVINIPGQLSAGDRNDIVAFLQSMTDPRVALELPPFDRPRLWSEGANVPQGFGAGSAGSGGSVPSSVVAWPAYAGNPVYTLGLQRALGGALHFLVLDVLANAQPNMILGQPVYLGMSGALSTLLLPQLTEGVGPGDGCGQLSFAIPNGMQGTTLYGQWLVLDPAGSNGMAVSNAFRVPLF